MTYNIYVLRSKKDHSIYVDYTTDDMEQRLEAHNNGLIKYTCDHRPWSLVYCKSSESLADSARGARKFRFIRRSFKSIKNRIKNRLSKHSIRSLLLPGRMSFAERYLITKAE
ncbi:MAG: GIY-YIG nuclease family protein [Candidatus Omnitrophota bacterium]